MIHEEVKDGGDDQWGKPILGQNPLAKNIADALKGIIDLCDNLELPMTKAPASRIINEIASKRFIPTYVEIATILRDIITRLSDELDSRVFITLSPVEARYYSPKYCLFGQEFETKFRGSGVFELDESAKCLAIGRSTASVFHLMRLMEIGIGAVARCLNVPDPIKPSERNWGKILERIYEGIDRRWPNSVDKMAGDGALFEALYASLDAVKNPWRNATMHVENKYTTDEAEHIFIAVKGFMKRVASRCDANGDPKA